MSPSTRPDGLPSAEIAAEIGANPLFADLAPAFREMIVGCARMVEFAAGERLLSIGDPADRFWLLSSGRIDVEIHGPSRGTLTVQRLRSGDVLGVSWIAAPYRAEFDATAIESGSAVVIDASCLRGKCREDPELGSELYRRFASLIRDRLHATRMQLIDLYEES